MPHRLQRHPVYQQLNDLLRTALARDYVNGDRFLTEREISETFEVSRATANKALASLVSEGVLEFRRGIGTFVRRNVIDYDVRSLVSFNEKARAAGKKPTTEVLTFGPLPVSGVPEEIRRALQCTPEEVLWEMERLRLADGVPVILEHRFVPQRFCPRLTLAQVSGSLYTAWTRYHGLDIGGADEVIRGVLLTGRVARLLQVSSRSAGLEVNAVGMLADQSPLWWEQTWYRGDRYEFQTRLGPIQSATPARGKLR